MRRRSLIVLLNPLFLVALAGCGSNTVKVTGQLMENGQPATLPEKETLELHFATVGKEPAYDFLTFVKKDGSFVADVNNNSGGGLPPGKYRFTLQSDGDVLGAKMKGKPDLKAEFEVVAGKPVVLSVDLAKGKTTVQ